MMMRTTLTLDEDVAKRLKAAARKSGKSFKEIVNAALRNGLEERTRGPRRRFVVEAKPMKALAGVNFDCIPELLEQLEGPNRP